MPYQIIIHQLQQLIAPLIKPKFCLICNDRSAVIHHYVCTACYPYLPWIKQACFTCGRELLGTINPSICGYCLRHPPAFDQAIINWTYQPIIARFIIGLKFHQQLAFGQWLGHWLANKIITYYQQHSDTKLPDRIIPMPLHAKRLRQRGYNQALEIARPIAKVLKIPMHYNYCQRIHATQPQTELTASARKKNVQGAFRASSEVAGLHVAIVDDVITTGHTITAMCKALQNANVAKITVWCCARVDFN